MLCFCNASMLMRRPGAISEQLGCCIVQRVPTCCVHAVSVSVGRVRCAAHVLEQRPPAGGLDVVARVLCRVDRR